MGLINIKGVELDFNALDARDMKDYEDAYKEMLESLETMSGTSDMLPSEMISGMCTIVGDFFDRIFGAGTAQDMFGCKEDIDERMNAAFECREAITKQVNDCTTKINSMSKDVKGQPVNRRQRRHIEHIN